MGGKNGVEFVVIFVWSFGLGKVILVGFFVIDFVIVLWIVFVFKIFLNFFLVIIFFVIFVLILNF